MGLSISACAKTGHAMCAIASRLAIAFRLGRNAHANRANFALRRFVMLWFIQSVVFFNSRTSCVRASASPRFAAAVSHTCSHNARELENRADPKHVQVRSDELMSIRTLNTRSIDDCQQRAPKQSGPNTQSVDALKHLFFWVKFCKTKCNNRHDNSRITMITSHARERCGMYMYRGSRSKEQGAGDSLIVERARRAQNCKRRGDIVGAVTWNQGIPQENQEE